MRIGTVVVCALAGMSLASVAGYALGSSHGAAAPKAQRSAEAIEDGSAEARDEEAYSAEVMADTPVAYFRLEEIDGLAGPVNTVPSLDPRRGAPTVTASFGGILKAVPTSPFGGIGASAIAFERGGVRINGLKQFTAAPAYTVEAWVAPKVFDVRHRGIFSSETDESRHIGARMYVFATGDEKLIRFGHVRGFSTSDVTCPFPDDGEYHHVVGTVDARDLACIYIDGVASCDTIHLLRDLSTESVLIGKRSDSDEAFVGSIAHVALYDRALSAARVRAHFDARTH